MVARGYASPFTRFTYEGAIRLPYTKNGKLCYKDSTVRMVNLKSPQGRVVKRNLSHEEAHVVALINAGWELTHDEVTR